MATQIESRNEFVIACANNPLLNESLKSPSSRYTFHNLLWAKKKQKASMVCANLLEGEVLYGENLTLSEDEILEAEDKVISAANKTPYGDVSYADPGYQKDGKKRYPIDTPEHIRAAWNYVHKQKNGAEYSGGQLSKIKSRIVSAWKRKIDPKGPPSAA